MHSHREALNHAVHAMKLNLASVEKLLACPRVEFSLVSHDLATVARYAGLASHYLSEYRNMQSVTANERLANERPDSTEPKPVEAVDHPRHYNNHPSGIEAIDIVEHMNFNLGNAVKYMWRAGEKGKALEDMKKARWYVVREMERLGEDAISTYMPNSFDFTKSQQQMFLITEPRMNIRGAVTMIWAACYNDCRNVRESLKTAVTFIDVEIQRLQD